MPRVTQPSTGSSTTRRTSPRGPAWCRPRPRGRARTGTTRSARSSGWRRRRSSPGRCRRCRPAAGGCRTQPGPGSSGGSTSARRSGPRAAPRPGTTDPATRAAANRSSLRSNRSAFIAGLRSGGRCARPFGRQCARASGGRSAAAAEGHRGLRPLLHQPAPLAGQGRQAGLGVDGHREADGLEHRQVGGGVGVGDALGELEALGIAVVRQELGPGLTGRRDVRRARRCRCRRAWTAISGGDDLVEEGPQRLDDEVDSAPVISTVRWPTALVLAHAADAGREALGEDQPAEQLGGVGVDLLDGAPS